MRKYTSSATGAGLEWEPARDKREALFRFFELLLYMQAYGTEDYAELDELDGLTRQSFDELVQYRLLFAIVQFCKKDLLRVGVNVPDDWLGISCAGTIQPGKPLEENARKALGAVSRQVWIEMQRHEPSENANRTPDTKPDTGKISSPQSVEVHRFIQKLKRDLRPGVRFIDVARDFADGDEKKAESLLRRARRYSHLWKTDKTGH